MKTRIFIRITYLKYDKECSCQFYFTYVFAFRRLYVYLNHDAADENSRYALYLPIFICDRFLVMNRNQIWIKCMSC